MAVSYLTSRFATLEKLSVIHCIRMRITGKMNSHIFSWLRNEIMVIFKATMI